MIPAAKMIKDFARAIEIKPDFVDPYMGRAEVLIVEKADLDGGIRDYDKAISLDPTKGKAYSARGEALRLKGRLDRAMIDHEEALRLNPSAESYGNRALTWKSLALASKSRALTSRLYCCVWQCRSRSLRSWREPGRTRAWSFD